MRKQLIQLFVFSLFIGIFAVRSASAVNDRYLKVSYSGTSISTIDQALVMDNSELVDEMAVGVLNQNEMTGNLELGMALDQSVSDDGTVYTFNLRQDVPWVRFNPESGEVEQVLDCDGNVRYVNAHDFVYGAERSLRPSTASDYAFALYFLQGGEEYNTSDEGTVSFDIVGAKALSDFTIEYTFRDPGAYNINVLSMWISYAQPSWIIEGDACNEKLGDLWIESGNYQGYGPFTLEEWIHDASLSMIRNPFWPGIESIPQAMIPGVRIAMLEESAALAEYEANNMDIANIPAADYDRLHADPVLSQEIVEMPGDVATNFVLFNPNLAPTDDVRVRLALSKSIDKEAIVTTLRSGRVAQIFLNPALTGAPHTDEYPNLGIPYDAEGARELIESYCADQGISPADVEISFLFPAEDEIRVHAEMLQFMWESALGIKVNLKSVEWSVFVDLRKESSENVYRAQWSKDYMDANNFSADMFLCGATYQKVPDWPTKDCTDVSDPQYSEYAETVIAAGQEQDPEKRVALYARTEEIIVSEAVIVAPIFWPSSEELRKPYIEAPISLIGNNRFEKWQILE